jgi:hypothetical protein
MLKAFFNIGFTLPQPPSNLRGQSRADYIARRKFYDLTADYNYFSYTLNGKKVVKNKDAEQYYTRGGTNGGLFDMHGALSEEQVQEMKAQLETTRSIIWHGVISFDDDTSKGFETQESAVKFLNQTFGSFIDRTQMNRNNICVFASLHKDTDHRHIHFAFFEKAPKRRYKDGTVDYTRRGKISQKAIDNYLVSANMHLSEHGEEYYSARDRALARLKELRREGFGKRAQREVRTAITELTAGLPAKGRLQYNSDNMKAYRPMIDRVADLIIQSDPAAKQNHIAMLKEFARVQAEVRALAQDNKLGYINGRRMDKAQIEAIMTGEQSQAMPLQYIDLKNVDYFDRLKDDYKARVGNVILGVCKDLRRDAYFDRRRAYYKVCSQKMKARNFRRRRESLLMQVTRALSFIDKKEQANFIKSVQEIEREQEMERKGIQRG